MIGSFAARAKKVPPTGPTTRPLGTSKVLVIEIDDERPTATTPRGVVKRLIRAERTILVSSTCWASAKIWGGSRTLQSGERCWEFRVLSLSRSSHPVRRAKGPIPGVSVRRRARDDPPLPCPPISDPTRDLTLPLLRGRVHGGVHPGRDRAGAEEAPSGASDRLLRLPVRRIRSLGRLL
eukprot:1193653-Prorocentrum_minimum.AAC.7